MSKTYQEQFDSAMKCETEAEAKKWMAAEIVYHMNMTGNGHEEARRIILVNLGYMAGYYSHETAQKINRLFGAVHPIFGSADYHKTVSSEEAVEAGVKYANQKGR